MSKDGVPVIYHDFKVSEAPSKPAINHITAKEFECFGPSPAQKSSKLVGGVNCIYHRMAQLRRHNSTSALTSKSHMRDPNITDLQKFASTCPSPDATSHQLPKINLPFTTLKHALIEVPSKIGFNIEVKYPNIKQRNFHGLDPMELNKFVDAILKVVAENAGPRKICFSSFNSEVCIVLCSKQNLYPVFYLSDAGTTSLPDTHDSSLHSAMRFALDAGCVGIVSYTFPLLLAPRLIHLVREKGLILMAYGPGTEDFSKVMVLKSYGIDGIITDRVPDLYKNIKQ